MQNKRRKISRNNFFVLLTEESFFSIAFTFIDTTSVVPVFVYLLTESIVMSGLSTALKTVFFVLPQLVMGLYNNRIVKLPSFMRKASFIFRLPFFIFSVLYFLDIIPSSLTILLFIASFILLNSADGVINVAWLDIFGRTIPKDKKSLFFGLMLSLGGFFGFLSSFAIKYVLSLQIPSEKRYSLLFLIGSIFILLSSFSYIFLKDYRRDTTNTSENILRMLKALPVYFKNNIRFSHLIVTQVFYNFNNLCLPLYIVFAQERFNLSENTVSNLIYMLILGVISGGFIWALISRYSGNKNTIRITLLLNIAVPLLAFVVFKSSGANNILMSILAFTAGILSGGWLGFTNYLLEIIGEKERAVYVGITDTITLPLSLTSFLGAVIAKYFGYTPVFIIVAFIMSMAFLSSLKLD